MKAELATSSSSFIFSQLVKFLKQRKNVALVTIIETSGSTPQIAGAKALVSQEGLVAGTVGGGLFEATMIEKAKALLTSQEDELLFWNFAAKEEEEGSICGGQALVLIEANPEKNQSVFEGLMISLERGLGGLLITLVEKKKGGKLNLNRFFLEEKKPLAFPVQLKNQFQETLQLLQPGEIADLFQKEESKLIKKISSDGEENYLFLEPVLPPPKLLIFGAGHVGQAVAQLGLFLGFEVYLFDDRRDLNLSPLLKNRINFIVADLAKSLEDFPTDRSCYLVIVTRGHRQDAQVLRVALKKEAGYVGMIGSRRKVALMKEDFRRNGWATDEDWSRIHSPIGLDIGAQTVEEIALSIMAEIISIRRQKGKIKE